MRTSRSVVLSSGLGLFLGLGLLMPSGRATAADQEKTPPKKGAVKSETNFIDAFIRKTWDEAKLKPSPIAGDEEYMRRVYLDLIGRIPTVEESLAFLGSKESGKRRKLVEILLNNPEFAKNFGSQWTILLIGRQNQGRMVDRGSLNSWLRQQFLQDTPWDKVVFELVTAKGSIKENGAVNFTLAHMEGGAVPLTSNTTRLFLGQQIQCTQCHDHPTNTWKQKDFWGINAFYKGLRAETIRKADAAGVEVDDHIELSDEPSDEFSKYDKRNGLVGIEFPRFLDNRKISQGKDVDRRLELGKFIADPKNKDLAKAFVNRVWGHLMGRGIVHPVDDFGEHNTPSHPELLEKLGEEFQKSNYDVKAVFRWITSSEAYNLSSRATKWNEKDESLFSHMALKPMSPEQLFDSLLTATAAQKAGGDRDSSKRRDAWLNQFVFTFANDEGDEISGFQGTIPQALMMMNGELMEQATGGKPGSFLADLCEEAGRRDVSNPAGFMVDRLYIAALSRHPSRREADVISAHLNRDADTIAVLQDIFWALLNSNEFVLNR